MSCRPAFAGVPATETLQPVDVMIGCGSCRYSPTGCADCERWHASVKAYREKSKDIAFFPETKLAVIDEGNSRSWVVRFYDSLRGGHQPSRDAASIPLSRLELVTVSGGLPHSVSNSKLQRGVWECGYFVRAFMEQECRKWRGEGMHMTRVSLSAGHMSWLDSIRHKWREGMTKKEQDWLGVADFA